MEPTLLQYADDVYSQNGEDGILREILSRLDLETEWFCEFGAWDGKHLSNCHRLLEQGWNGLMIEADEKRYSDLQETARDYPDKLHTVQTIVRPTGETSLENVLENSPAPQQFGILSIDVDGSDFYIWQSLDTYRPAIVVIEYNPQFGTDVRFASDLDPGGYIRPNTNERLAQTENDALRATGSSFRAMVELGERKGYSAVSATENNLVFLRDDFVPELALPDPELANPDHLFKREWMSLPWWSPPTPIYRRHPVENVSRLHQRYREGGVEGVLAAIKRAVKRDLL